MEAKAVAKYIRTSPRKARLVADELRGKTVGDALTLLEFSIKKEAANDISKVIKSAAANMQSSNPDINVDAESLMIKEIYIDKGPVMKRFRAKARGRAGRIIKRMCHITINISN